MRNSMFRVLTFASLAAPTTLAAQEEHGTAGGAGGLLTPHGGLMIWTLLIFLILWFVLARFAFKPLTAAVRAREQALEEAIAAAKRDREDAARLLESQRQQIESARNDAQRIIAEGRATAERMRADLLEQTHQQQHELLERARRDIDAEREKAILALRREAVDLAILGASKVIERNLDDQSNRRLVESYLSGIGTMATSR